MNADTRDIVPNGVSQNQLNSCTPARKAVCESIGDGPLGWRARRDALSKLRKSHENKSCGDISGTFAILLTQAVVSADKHRSVSLWWGRLHYILGIPAAILATVGGATALTSSQTLPAVLGLTAGGLSSAVAFLKCENSRDRNSALCAGWTELADQVRLILLEYDNCVSSGNKPDIDYYSYRLICLNKCKMELLWGILRAGPERQPSNSDPRSNVHLSESEGSNSVVRRVGGGNLTMRDTLSSHAPTA
jgi:hypothetical protein